MTGWPRLKNSNGILLAVLLVLFISCQEEEPKQIVVARAGNSALTEDELDSLLTISENKNKFREEVIRNWVDSEILFLEAEQEGITQNDNFLNLVEKSKKKLAGSLYLEKFISEQQFEVSENELVEYYLKNSSDFKIPAQAYVYNRAVFNDESKAILYRSTLIESDWSKAANVFAGDETLIFTASNNFKYVHELSSAKIKTVLDNLELGETSIIFEIEPGMFNIIQLVAKYEEGDTPDFTYVKGNVKEQYLSTQKTKSYEELLHNLYSKYDVIINR